MPPTKALSPSTITSFSWWQCMGRSRSSSAHCTRVPRMSSSRSRRTRRREGLKTGSGAPAQSRTLTSTRSASSPSRSRNRHASRSRVSPKSGVRCQPAMWTWERASARAAAMADRASSPSMRTRKSQPSRGRGSPALHSEPSRSGSSCSRWPSRASLRRWCTLTTRSMPPPAIESMRPIGS